MTGLPPRLPLSRLSERDAFNAFIGGWQLELWTTFHKEGSEDYPFGRDAVGQIMYSADGHMTCHLMQADRPMLDAPSIYQVTDEQLGRAMRAHTGYFGTFPLMRRKASSPTMSLGPGIRTGSAWINPGGTPSSAIACFSRPRSAMILCG